MKRIEDKILGFKTRDNCSTTAFHSQQMKVLAKAAPSGDPMTTPSTHVDSIHHEVNDCNIGCYWCELFEITVTFPFIFRLLPYI